MSRVRAICLVAALAFFVSAAAQDPGEVAAENERRAKAGLLPRKEPPQKPPPAKPKAKAQAEAPQPAPGPTAPAATAPPSPAVEATRTQHSAPVPPARPTPTPPTPRLVPMAATPRAPPPQLAGPLDVAVAAARGLSPGPSAPATLGIDAVPAQVLGLSVKASTRVRAGAFSLSVESPPR